MNKYQKALNYLDWHCNVVHKKQQDLLQELVDRETPIKPILREFINKYDCEDYEYLCGKCKDHLAYHRGRVDRCNDNECNQLADWSDEE